LEELKPFLKEENPGDVAQWQSAYLAQGKHQLPTQGGKKAGRISLLISRLINNSNQDCMVRLRNRHTDQ
ncbi:hypothetical protein V4Y02_24075, partial [Escherichia coli]